jgi:ABC-2 type transport system permease protein
VTTRSPDRRRVRRAVQVSGFLRKETVALVRQPRLLLVLVAGPFLILLLFGIGYDEQQSVVRTAFVGPEGSIYEESIDQFADDLVQYVVNAGYSDDLLDAERRLAAGEIDAIVLFPADPFESVLAGEQAEIAVLHDKIDPLQQVAIDVSAQVAVMELNARVLEEIVTRAQDQLVPLEGSIDTSSQLTDELLAAIADGDDERRASTLAELRASVTAIDTLVRASAELADALGGDPETVGTLAELETDADSLDAAVEELVRSDGDIDDAEVESLRGQLDDLALLAESAATIDPGVVVRPFTGETASLQRGPIEVNDYFAPAAVALLLQHMVLTFAAMSLVTDRGLGMFEVFRVGPVDAGLVMIGKYFAFMLAGGAVGAALMFLVTTLLGTPMRGDPWWIAGGMVGLLASSVGFGMLLALLARSDVQAVQFSMLALLASLFFGGFFLDLDAFNFPVRLLAWVLPVTYGTRLFRDVMLRGADPDIADLIGLAVATVGFAAVSWMLLHRRLRVR